MKLPGGRGRIADARLASGAFLSVLIIWIVARDYPMVGHDLRYYVPRLLDTLLHLQLNGIFAVQWYTPTFGGGVPAYPNPQHLQHSVLQALTFIVNPWLAFLVTTAAVSLIGFYTFAWLLERRVGLNSAASTLGAVFFLGNGFYIEHLIVGHVGFQLFPLAALMLSALTDAERGIVANACVVALVVAAMLYHAGVYLIILMSASLLVVIPMLIIARPSIVDLRRVAGTMVMAVVLAAAIGASKVYAVMAFMRHFPREIDDSFNVGLLQGLAGFALQLAGVMSLAPLLAIAGIDPARVGAALSSMTGASSRFGIWELDVGLSPVLWLVIAVGIVQAAATIRTRGWPAIEERRFVALVALTVIAWLLVEATLARGLVYSLVKPLPILRSLHVNPRLAAAFIMPLAILAAIVAHRWSTQATGRSPLPLLLVLAVASPVVYLWLPATLHLRSFDIALSVDTHKRIDRGDAFDVRSIAVVEDAAALAINASSYLPYEPLFGYDLEDFARQTMPGDVRQVHGGAFNMTNPAGLVFPELNGLRPFQRIAQDDRGNLEALLHRREPQWAIPPLQRQLNWLSAAAFFVTLAGALVRFPLRPKRAPLSRVRQSWRA